MDDPVKVFFEIDKKTNELEKHTDKLLRKYSIGMGPFKGVPKSEDAMDIIDQKYEEFLKQVKEIEKQKNELQRRYLWYKPDYMKKIKGSLSDENVAPKLDECFKRLDEKIEKLYTLLEKKYNDTILTLAK